jgi:hypothetical protein
MEHKTHSEAKKALCEHIDAICSYLSAGSHWHRKAANASRKIGIRGFGRWHDCEAEGDFCCLEKLNKIVFDKLKHEPVINMEMSVNAEGYTMNSLDCFKRHFKLWVSNENELIDRLNDAIHHARTVDMQIYNCLVGLCDEVQSEIMRATMARDSLDFAGWNPHDISVKSRWIHEYFEHEHEGGDININLG